MKSIDASVKNLKPPRNYENFKKYINAVFRHVHIFMFLVCNNDFTNDIRGC